MTIKHCSGCGQAFQPRPQVPNQAFCSAPKHASASESINGSRVSCNQILITGATSDRLNALGKKAIPTTGVNIMKSTQNMHSAVEIHNGPSHLTTQVM
ncbi:hypothetical protein LP419_21855 [Massilia sp. H-1]|nr:hypothetical protein LP419_21855 [Massilia sp. H-1]